MEHKDDLMLVIFCKICYHDFCSDFHNIESENYFICECSFVEYNLQLKHIQTVGDTFFFFFSPFTSLLLGKLLSLTSNVSKQIWFLLLLNYT